VSTKKRRWTSNGKYWFDKHAADAACAFFETYLCLTIDWFGGRAGAPFRLARWQRRIVRKVFGWKRADGTRRYRRVWLEVPRKNGKTEFAAGLALLLLVADGEFGAQVYSIASEEGQAKIVFERATRMVASSPALKREIEAFKTSLYCSALTSAFKPLTAAPSSKQGFAPSGCIADEVHVWNDGELYDAVHEGEGSRAQPLDVMITTAGEKGTYADEQHEYALEVQRGITDDEELFVAIYGAADDDDWTDPKIWAKANPNYGVSVNPDFLASECRKARQLPRLENRFRRYYLDQWVEQSVRWIPMEYWDVCTSAPEERARSLFLSDPDRDEKLKTRVVASGRHGADLWKRLPDLMAGRPCAGGLDLATTRDIAAWCLWFPPERPGARETLIWKFWLPRDTLKQLKDTERRRYEAWAKDGALVLTPGNVTDYDFIKRDILSDSLRYRLAALGVDRWNATQLATDLLNTEGLPVELFGQGYASMSGPSKEFERLVMAGLLDHGGHPVLRWMVGNVAIRLDTNGNFKPDKEKSSEKIDGVVAAIMALGLAIANDNQESIYDQEARQRAKG
jgi:phage terminase large subunit-like protein